jgi:hypothetical protein
VLAAALAALDYLLRRTELLSHLTHRVLARDRARPPPFVVILPEPPPPTPDPPPSFDRGLVVPIPGRLMVLDASGEGGLPVLGVVMDATAGGSRGAVSWIPTEFDRPIEMDAPASALALVICRVPGVPGAQLRLGTVEAAGVVSGVQVFVVE